MLKPDETTGYVSIDVHGDGRWVRLRRPKLRQWADWSDHVMRLRERNEQARTAALVGGDAVRMHEAVEVAGPVAALNVEMIRTLAAETIIIEPDDPAMLALSNLTIAERLLTFWWECPLAPWPLNAPPPVDELEQGLILAPSASRARDKGKEKRKITTSLPGALGALSMIYQVFATVGFGSGPTPPQLDEMEIFQVAVLMGRDRSPDEVDEHGGTVRHRGDGQEESRSFARDPEQPLFFAPGADKAAAWKWLQAKRTRAKNRARQQGTNPTVKARPKPARTWRKGL